MLHSILLKTVRDQRRGLAWWSLGMFGFTALLVLFFPSIRDNPAMQDYVEALPPELLAFFGGNRFALIHTPEGYLDAELFSLMLPIMFLVLSITMGSGLIAGEEERGRLEILVTEPVSRRRVYLEQAGAIGVALLALTVILWVSLVISALLVDMRISIGNLAAASMSLWLIASAFGMLAMALGGLTGKRGLTVSITAAVGVLMYFLNALGSVIEALEPARRLSLFYYYNENFPLANGLDVVHATVLLVVALLLAAIGMAGFERRDLRV